MKLLDFNLEEALKEPERVVFANGAKPLDWHCFENTNLAYPLYLVIDSDTPPIQYTKLGKFHNSEINHPKDLKLLPKTKTWHFCVYSGAEEIFASCLYSNAEEMRQMITKLGPTILQEYTYTQEIP